jgi:large subunit ribosomal protein L18
MNRFKALTAQRSRRQMRVRKKLHGTATKPRLSIYRSNMHLYAQLIDDDAQKTLSSFSTLQLGEAVKYGGTVKAAQELGKKVAEGAKAKGIDGVVFDRGHYKYHGRIKALADAARSSGLKF